MATQVNGTEPPVSAEMVGNAFVSQFYTHLHASPEVVHKFFMDSSTMSRPGPDGTLLTVTSMKGINELLLSLNCKEYKAEILTADAQSSYEKGVIVLVTGCLTGKDNVIRKFTESFFLAPQDNGYFVLNNSFRFVEEASSPPVNSVEEKKVDKIPLEAPLAASQETVDSPAEQIVPVPVDTPEFAAEKKIDAVVVPRDEPKTSVTEVVVSQAPTDTSCDAPPVIETTSNGHVDAPKKSYAELLRGSKENASKILNNMPALSAKAAAPKLSAKAARPNSTQVPIATGTPSTTHVPVAPAAASNSHAVNGNNTNGSRTALAEDKGGYSVYIGDLPWDATVNLVEQEFKKFGNIKRNGIQVRSNKGYCFGFVEYEDASAKDKALKSGTIQICGKEAVIEDKKTDTKVINGVSMYSSGRGNFRNDGFRGRGNYSNGRGYPRNDFVRNDYNNKRNGDVPPPSSRNGDGYVYQNGNRGGGGGARGGGARQGVAPK